MTIQFVVEDGTGKINATSYATVEQYKQYCDNYGKSYSTQTDAQIQEALNYATMYIDTNFNFIGQKTDYDNALEWPRSYNNYQFYDELPVGIVNATCSLAFETFTSSLFVNSSNVQSESYGPVSKTYRAGGQNIFTEGVKWLKKYIVSGNGMVRVN